jgi:hypothetical protein
MFVLLRNVLGPADEPLRKAGGGALISTSSVACIFSSPSAAAYARSKGALTWPDACRRAAAWTRSNPGKLHMSGRHQYTELDAVPGINDSATLEQAFSHVQTIRYRLNGALLASDESSQWTTGLAMSVDGGLTVGSQFSRAEFDESEAIPSGYIGPSFNIYWVDSGATSR